MALLEDVKTLFPKCPSPLFSQHHVVTSGVRSESESVVHTILLLWQYIPFNIEFKTFLYLKIYIHFSIMQAPASSTATLSRAKPNSSHFSSLLSPAPKLTLGQTLHIQIYLGTWQNKRALHHFSMIHLQIGACDYR